MSGRIGNQPVKSQLSKGWEWDMKLKWEEGERERGTEYGGDA